MIRDSLRRVLARRRSLAAALLCLLLPHFAAAEGTVFQLDLEGPLGVATAEYIINGIDEANERNGKLVIIRMDTPGGLVDPTRDIVSRILSSEVPVATYVSPGGARAASAGTYIVLASHIAAMSPTTHLGAATPVSLGGEDAPSKSPFGNPPAEDESSGDAGNDDSEASPDENGEENSAANDAGSDAGSDAADEKSGGQPGSAMERKVLNDAIAYIRGLADAHGRNADWAEKAVTEGATLTADKALEMNVIDLIAVDQAELLAAINGRTVTVNNRETAIETEGVVVERIEPSWRIKVLSTIANPQVALLLMIVGLYGLLFEGYNPGAIVPGVVGVICLLLAAYALQVIPVNYAGLALIVLGIVLIVAEAFVPSFGALGLGGIAAFVFGAIMMFDSGVPGYGISITFVLSVALVAGLLLLWMVTFLVKLRNRGAVSGEELIEKGIAVARESFTREGFVWLEGELWQATSPVPVQQGQQVRVRHIDGLKLRVEPLGDGAAEQGSPEAL
ncbi:MAG: nodulation protein NfeD [Woeseia sp.]